MNWKNVGDNYSDNLHIPVAHDGLTRLFGKSYAIEAQPWVDKMSGNLTDRPSGNPWERFYQTHLPRVDHLPEANQRMWRYYKLWPNMAFDLYADQIDFMQWLPTGPTTCSLREMAFALPDERREMRLVRYANWRINRVVNAEDTWLIERVQHGMATRSYTAGPIGASEVCLRSFAKKIRGLIPEARLHRAPAAGWSNPPRTGRRRAKRDGGGSPPAIRSRPAPSTMLRMVLLPIPERIYDKEIRRAHHRRRA